MAGVLMNMIDTPEIIIRYKDSERNVLERTISDISLYGDKKINAFCHLRSDIRTFHIANIEQIIDPKTRNVEKNPWKYFGLTESAGIVAMVHPFLPAIKSLKLFAKLIRGFSKRERMHIVHFIIDNLKIKNYSEEIVDEWIHKLYATINWDECINVYDFKAPNTFSCLLPLIKEIPDELMPQCRETALNIAVGSGRKQIPIDIINWINAEFTTDKEKERGLRKDHIYILHKWPNEKAL